MKKPKVQFLGKVIDMSFVKEINSTIDEVLNDIENDTSMPKSKEERDKAFAELRRRFAKRKK